jgi:hypothetical protein
MPVALRFVEVAYLPNGGGMAMWRPLSGPKLGMENQADPNPNSFFIWLKCF